MALKKIVSFGFKYPDPPDQGPGDVVVDVRALFRNPWRKLRSRPLTAEEIEQEILSTPNFEARYAHVKATATAPGTEVAFIGCYGGKHRSVFLAERLGRELGIPVEHRDIDREVAHVGAF